MTIWLLALFLWASLASLGSQQGVLRTAISLAGVVAASFLSFKLDHILRPFVPLAGIYNPVWYWFLPPLAVFLIVAAVFYAIAQLVHRKVDVFYKYKAVEEHRLAWNRLNRRLGLCLGLAAGTAYLLLISQVVVVAGYFTGQMKPAGDAPLTVRWINALREDITGSGLDKMLAAVDPTPSSVYDAADAVGLLYHNPELGRRLADYPLFLSLAEQQEFKDIAANAELRQMLQQQANLQQIAQHTNVQAVMKSERILKQLRELEPRDLLAYLKTGQSSKYAAEKILGRWELDAFATVFQYRKDHTNTSMVDLRKLQDTLNAQFTTLTLTATTDGQIFVKGLPNDFPALARLVTPPKPSATTNRRRPAPPPVDDGSTPPPPSPSKVIFQGTWKKEGEKYAVTVSGDKGEKSGEASVTENGKLALRTGGQTLMFGKPE